MQDKIKVLIVDDSLIFRRALESVLAAESDMSVIGSVWNGVKAIEAIKKNRPDIVTLDMEMPELDGLETLKAIQEINGSSAETPIGVIMLSSFTKDGADITLRALQLGAFDFIAKPEFASAEENVAFLRNHLPSRIRSYKTGKRIETPVPAHVDIPVRDEKAFAAPLEFKYYQAVLIGVSTGGPKALNDMLPLLCSMISLPVLIVQHMPPKFTKSLAEQLAKKCSPYKVVEASDGDIVRPGTVYIAPGGRHMTVKRTENGIIAAMNDDKPENGSRPSVDVMFRSAASVYGPKAVALILTGMGTDGNKGLAALRSNGVHVIAQDETSSVVWGMPGCAVASGNVDEVVPLMEIPAAVLRVLES